MSEDVQSHPTHCNELSEDNDRCDLQPDHGGNMHSGVLGWPYSRRIWWDKATRKIVYFGRTVPSVQQPPVDP